MITVFYDGKCGNCSREINYYKRISNPEDFHWEDITQHTELLSSYGVTLREGLERIHVADSTGKLHIGVDGFILMWSKIKYWKALGIFTSLPIIKQIAQFLYARFARYRFNKLDHCKVTLNQ